MSMKKDTGRIEREVPIVFEAEVSVRAKFIQNLRYGYGALLQTRPEVSGYVAESAERESTLENLVIGYDIGDFEAKFNAQHEQTIVGDRTPNNESLRFASFSVDFLRKMVNVCQKKEGGFIPYKQALLNRKIDMMEKRQVNKEGDALMYWSHLSQEIQDLKEAIAGMYGVKSLKMVLTGIDLVPEDEQPEIFNIVRGLQIPGSFPQPIVLSEHLPATFGVRADGVQVGIRSDRLTIAGYNEIFDESLVALDQPQLTG